MANKKSWFSIIKRLFISEPHSRLEKNDKRRRRRWAFRLLKVKELPPLSAPSQIQEENNVEPVVAQHDEIQSSSARDLAATKIQAVFRGYLARKALGALKGVVKLQALIRGWAVRQQAINTLKCLQSLVNIQAQVFSKKCTTLHSQHYKSQEKDIKVDLNSQKRLNNEEIKEYYLNHRRSAETERDRAYGRRRYWLEQWVDAQLAKSGGSPNLDRTLSASARSRKNQAESPTYIPKRSYHHRKQRSIGDEHSFVGVGSGSPSLPAYMASTESAKARSRSLSSPRLRPLSFDVCSEITSPYKHKLLSPISSINSELTSNTWAGNYIINSSPRLKGLPIPGTIKSTMSTKEVRLHGIHHQNGTSE